MGFDLGNFLSGAAKAAGDAVQTVEKIPGVSDAVKSVAGQVGVDAGVVGAIVDAGTKIANASPTISAAGNLGKDVPGYSHGFALGVGSMQTPIDKPQHLAVLRGSLPPGSQHGFDTALALHLGTVRRPAPPLPPKARAAYQITHGMVGAPVAQKDLLMETIAVDPDARPGAVQAIKEVASSRETLWEKAMNAAGLHGLGDPSNRDYKFGQDDDDGDDDGGDGDGGDGDGDGDGDGGGGGGGGNGGGGDGSPQQPQTPKKKKKHHHHPHHAGHHAAGGHRGHPAAPHHHGETMMMPPGAEHGYDPSIFEHREWERHHREFEHRPFEPYQPYPAAPMPAAPPGHGGGGPDAGHIAANVFDPMHLFHDKPKNVGDVLKNVFDPLHIFGEHGIDAPLMPPAPEHRPYGPPVHRAYGPPEHRPAPHPGHGPDAGDVAANVLDPMHLFHKQPKSVGDVLKNIFDPLHIFGDPTETESSDFGKHHKKHKDQMGAELPPSAVAFGAEAFHYGCEVGCAMAGEASYAGEMQTDPQGHVALYGAQHDPREWEPEIDPLWEVNARVDIAPEIEEVLEKDADDHGLRVAVEGIMP